MTTQLTPPAATPTGNTYDKYGSTNPIEQRMMRGFMRALDDMLAGLAPRRILEIGVGEGHVMTRVRERFPGVPLVGVDLPDDALGDEWKQKGLPCMFGDATTLPFPDDSFDLVLAIEVLEHVPGPEAALTELALREGPRQHARPRQPLDPLGLPEVRRVRLPRPTDAQPPALDDDPSHLPLSSSSGGEMPRFGHRLPSM
jgi:SAM-dependent methyltransferase